MSSTEKDTLTPLFDGAIVAELPANFADVSKLRQVPDNQEVFIDKDGYTSIIVEICERFGSAGSSAEIDGEALTVHLEDLVGDDADSVKVWNTTETEFSQLPAGTPAYTLIATQTPHRGHAAGTPDFTAIILTLVRLESEATDILITVNVPHIKGEYDEDDVDIAMGKQGQLIGDAVEYAANIWSTFEIKNWKLFNGPGRRGDLELREGWAEAGKKRD
ncbi:Mog1/PsbP, alpha/beta/alpha sandwich [Niveomyces insectorum RCEF 264]|uniref:Mog1/PsbP, alpha/beta/alpha sandwich n=1 Tax=Niveomyces insectorum RCEF 264 TaxID=1081102 RepID=A0A167SIB9_9HYPO|nr:Mog1/PsbP, alpha/beta/alpha sandwich [Niveomyces insectorum RCEF 264]